MGKQRKRKCSLIFGKSKDYLLSRQQWDGRQNGLTASVSFCLLSGSRSLLPATEIPIGAWKCMPTAREGGQVGCAHTATGETECVQARRSHRNSVQSAPTLDDIGLPTSAQVPQALGELQ